MHADYYLNSLYPLQDRALKSIEKINQTFYLTGGTAISRIYLHHRFSDDLDLFVNRHPNFQNEAIMEQANMKDMWINALLAAETLSTISVDKLKLVSWITQPNYEDLLQKLQIISRDILLGHANSLYIANDQ